MQYDDQLWLLPAGVEEILPPKAQHLEQCRRDLIDLFISWGYELVIPPLVEYLESLLAGAGNDVDLKTFKLIDQPTGRLMGVRADMTPQVARMDARKLHRGGPTRLCYLGTVLHTLPDGLSGERCPMQVGAELYGHRGVESDCEVICLLLETLRVAGVRNVHLDLGHMGIFRALMNKTGLTAERSAALFDVLQRKALAELNGLLDGWEIGPRVARMITALADLNGGEDTLARARTELAPLGAEVDLALRRLGQVAQTLRLRTPGVELHFDLAELRGYHYEQGIVFAAFVAERGQEIARGGRYDNIGALRAEGRPAVGFSTDLKTLVQLGRGAVAPGKGAILAPWSDDARLQAQVHALRRAGERVVHDLPGQQGAGSEMGCDRVFVFVDGEWVLRPL